jgi:hypothetical protein
VRIRHLARNVVVVGTVLSALVLTGGVSQAVEPRLPGLPDLPIPVPTDDLPLPGDVPGLPDLPDLPGVPELPGVPNLPLPGDSSDQAPAPKSDLPDAPAPCSEPPSVDVDQSDAAYTTITISFVCESEKAFHKVISAEVAGTTILEIDTQTVTASYGAHATTLRVPKATICVTDVLKDAKKCLP